MKAPSTRPQIFLLLALCLAAIWISTAAELSRSKKSVLREAESSLLLQSQAFAEHSQSTIKRLDELLLDLRDSWHGDAAAFAELVRRRQGILADIAIQIGIIGPDGMLIFSNLQPITTPIDLSQREHFRVHRQAGESDRLFISKPLLGKVSGKWSIQFTRPILRQGKFAGVIVVSASPEVFSGFRGYLELSPEGIATVARDGAILARLPDGEPYYGKTLTGAAFDRPDAGGAGAFVKRAQTDGVERLYGYYKLPEYRMIFMLGERLETLFLPHVAHRNQVLITASLVSLMVLLLIGLVLRSLQARDTATQALWASEERYRQFFQVNTAIKLVIDPQSGLITDANQAAFDFYGYPRDTLLGMPFARIDGRSAEALGLAAQSADSEHRRYDNSRHHLASGEIRDVEVYSGPGEIDGRPMLYSIIHDITERKRLEAESRLLSAAVTQSNAAIMMTDADGNISFVNDAFERTTGYPRAEVIGLTPRLLQSGRTPLAVYQELWQTIIAGRTWRGEIYNRKKSGELYWEMTTISPVADAAGTITHFIAVKEDISLRKQHESELLTAKQAAEAANLAKSQFLATMSHEIRTPLNGILGMAQILLMPGLEPDEKQEAARTILNSGQTLLTLLNDILDLSKIEAGKLELARKAFAPTRLIGDTATLFQESARARGLALETSWPGNPDQRYWGDPIRIRQMLSNLVSNAIKFTEKGFLRIEGEERTGRDGQVVLVFTVIDSGIGIGPEQQANLFQPFSQVDSSNTRKFSGTGLGLSIVRRIAEQMGGATGVTSEISRGSRFWFEIPAERVADNEDSRQSERQPASLPLGEKTPKSALIVEDNGINRLVIQSILNKNGIATVCVEDGEQAVQAITGDGLTPDIVLMDCQMPVLDGFAATRQIRQWEQANNRPPLYIIALSAATYEEDRQRCSAAGMDDFVAKPIDVKALLATLGRLARR
ncbi:PAS domain S-box protein [Dechloromonas denitrificans]|uniref:PAS domain S-box protein n=1 Tax=Dechloromonas denitrificans TaxID=281362 RepID=UPI001CF9D3C5|nr:PAS domain S-box protein [Dechloromonas denitrificans]UCV09074.1 PAS domain S-box protein [Dechloromonas denitrificans]